MTQLWQPAIVDALSNVLHVPLANACLLSISKFTESNGTAQFRKGQVNLLQADGKLLGVGKGENGLYVLNTVNIPTDKAYLVVTLSASWDEWHRHFGHVAILGLKQLRANGLVTGFDVADSLPSSECGTCIAAKMAWTGFPDLNVSRHWRHIIIFGV